MPQLACIDCHAPVTFPEPSGDGTCDGCGLAQYLNPSGGQGHHPDGVGLNPLSPRRHDRQVD